MGHKLVCFTCRIAKNLSLDISTWDSSSKICVKCKSEMKILSHRFRPPQRENTKQWEVVSFLFSRGFRYEHIHDNDTGSYVKIPENMRDATEFLNIYKESI